MINDLKAEGEIVNSDVVNTDETENELEQIFKKHDNIEVLVNNAGITADGLFMMMSEKN